MAEGHHHRRLVLRNGRRQLLAVDIPPGQQRLSGQHRVGGERDGALVRLRERGHDQGVGLLLVVDGTELGTLQNRAVGVDDRLGQARRARRVHHPHRVVGAMPKPCLVAQRRRSRTRHLLDGLDPPQRQLVQIGRNPVPPLQVGVQADRAGPLAQRDRALPRRLPVDEHGDGAELSDGRVVHEICDGVGQEDRDPVLRPHALRPVPHRPALDQVVEVAEAELGPRLAVGVGHRSQRLDERLVRIRVDGQHRGKQVATADAGVRGHLGPQLRGKDCLVCELRHN